MFPQLSPSLNQIAERSLPPAAWENFLSRIAQSGAIIVVKAEPSLRAGQADLVATLGNQVEIMVSGIQHVLAAFIAGIGVEHRPAVIPVEHAGAGQLGH